MDALVAMHTPTPHVVGGGAVGADVTPYNQSQSQALGWAAVGGLLVAGYGAYKKSEPLVYGGLGLTLVTWAIHAFMPKTGY